jgi:hypothetical protein
MKHETLGHDATCPQCHEVFIDEQGLYYIALNGAHVCSRMCKKTYDAALLKPSAEEVTQQTN